MHRARRWKVVMGPGQNCPRRPVLYDMIIVKGKKRCFTIYYTLLYIITLLLLGFRNLACIKIFKRPSFLWGKAFELGTRGNCHPCPSPRPLSASLLSYLKKQLLIFTNNCIILNIHLVTVNLYNK